METSDSWWTSNSLISVKSRCVVKTLCKCKGKIHRKSCKCVTCFPETKLCLVCQLLVESLFWFGNL